MLAEIDGAAEHDPYYFDPKLTGADQITYQITLNEQDMAKVDHISVKLYSQSIPPFYLQQRFRDANVGPKQQNEIQRLFYLTSHLNTDATDSDNQPFIENWKLQVAGTCQTLSGPCQ